MKVILRQDVSNLGKKGDIKEVSEGYARNYLIPRGLAVKASRGHIKELNNLKRAETSRAAKEEAQAKELFKKLDGLSLTLTVKAGEEGKLFGSVTSSDIAAALAQKGFKIDRRKISLKNPIKKLGSYTLEVKLHPNISPQINIKVEPE